MSYFETGSLTTDRREVAISETWETQTDWEQYQSKTGITIENGIVKLSELTIPAQEDLYAHYDFSQEDGSLPVTDLTGNGRDLDGQYSGISVDINGVQAGSFDGSDDLISSVQWGDVSEPYHIFIVAQMRTNTDSYFINSNGQSGPSIYDWSDSSGAFRLYQGGSTAIDGANTDTNPHIHSGLFASTDVLRMDGSNRNSGDTGGGNLVDLYLGARGDNDLYADVKIGEVLIYPVDKSGIITDIETYLADKWGITL